MPRETVEEKAVRYLTEGRLRVLDVRGIRAYATCRGEEVYEIEVDGRERRCSCPARRRCAHLVALELVFPTPIVSREPSTRQIAEARAHELYHASRTGETSALPAVADAGGGWVPAPGDCPF